MCLASAGDLYTHHEVDEDDDDCSSKASLDRPASAVDVKTKNRLSGSFAESGSTSSSLQEFERLESEILRSASHSGTPQKTPQKIAGNHVHADPGDTADQETGAAESGSPVQCERSVTLTSQSTLSEIDEGHESQASDSGETVTGGSQESDTDSDAIDKQLTEMERVAISRFSDQSAETFRSSLHETESPTRKPHEIDPTRRTSSESAEPRKPASLSATDTDSAITGVQKRVGESRDDPASGNNDDEDEDKDESSGEREDEFDEDSCRTREESYRISHCMLASADSVELDLMTCSFRSEATMISSSEGLELASEPRLAYAGSSAIHTMSNSCVERQEHATTTSAPDAVYSSASTYTKTTHSSNSETLFRDNENESE